MNALRAALACALSPAPFAASHGAYALVRLLAAALRAACSSLEKSVPLGTGWLCRRLLRRQWLLIPKADSGSVCFLATGSADPLQDEKRTVETTAMGGDRTLASGRDDIDRLAWTRAREVRGSWAGYSGAFT